MDQSDEEVESSEEENLYLNMIVNDKLPKRQAALRGKGDNKTAQSSEVRKKDDHSKGKQNKKKVIGGQKQKSKKAILKLKKDIKNSDSHKGTSSL